MSIIFTKIINKEIPADIVYEDEICLAFKDVNPKAPVHVLLIPKKEIATMNDVVPDDKNILGHLMVKSSEIAKQLNLDKNGYRLVINTNEDAGQSVFHIHIHILGGRKMTWPPG
ncbi:MAG: histidine triad nucleotide-binding protein [Thermodesulfobacteriota bacterium]